MDRIPLHHLTAQACLLPHLLMGPASLLMVDKVDKTHHHPTVPAIMAVILPTQQEVMAGTVETVEMEATAAMEEMAETVVMEVMEEMAAQVASPPSPPTSPPSQQ